MAASPQAADATGRDTSPAEAVTPAQPEVPAEPSAPEQAAEAASAPAAAAQPAATADPRADAPADDPGRPRPGTKKNAKGRRSSVPSWDEIMLGSTRQRD